MLKALLVDDEDIIVQGLKVLIDWNAEGFEIAATASSGQEALDYLKHHRVDLVVMDVKMPGMTGLDLLKAIQAAHVSDAKFVVLSGCGEFDCAQRALRFGCVDYLLKPVCENDLVAVLRKINHISETEKREMAYLVHRIVPLLFGKRDDFTWNDVTERLGLSAPLRYIEIERGGQGETDIHGLYRACLQVLGDDGRRVYMTCSGAGFLLDGDFLKQIRGAEKEYFSRIAKELSSLLNCDIRILAGKRVVDAAQLPQSYETVCALKTVAGLREPKPVYFYEDEIQSQPGRPPIRRENVDRLVSAIRRNDRNAIRGEADALFREMRLGGMIGKDVNANIYYLFFRLTELASGLDSESNQEEIIRFISDASFDNRVRKGSREHLERFALEYADYLFQLGKTESSGVLQNIEREIRERYAENLTLQDLGRKYFINSSYLGQIFRKKYGMSFKGYLANYRVNQAARELLQTQKSVSQIALEVGYRDTDYFISKFIEAKGCTPSRFRRDGGGRGGHGL